MLSILPVECRRHIDISPTHPSIVQLLRLILRRPLSFILILYPLSLSSSFILCPRSSSYPFYRHSTAPPGAIAIRPTPPTKTSAQPARAPSDPVKLLTSAHPQLHLPRHIPTHPPQVPPILQIPCARTCAIPADCAPPWTASLHRCPRIPSAVGETATAYDAASIPSPRPRPASPLTSSRPFDYGTGYASG